MEDLSTPRKHVKDFGGVHFSCLIVEGRVVDSNKNGFLVYFLEVGDVGSWMVVGNAAYVNCTGDMTYSPNICWILCKKGYNFLLGRTIC